jgi:hypothetical protein
MPDFTISPNEWSADMWREAIKAVVRFGAQPTENLDDIVTAGWLLGQKRAELQGRPFWPGEHPQYPLMIGTWYWLKPSYSTEVREFIISKRGQIIERIHESVNSDGLQYVITQDNERFQKLMHLIPDHYLQMNIDELFERIRHDGGREVTHALNW